MLGEPAPPSRPHARTRLRDLDTIAASPSVAVGVSTVLFVAIGLLRLLVDDGSEAVTMLAVLPIALLATTFGLRGGIAAATVALGTFAVWALRHPGEVGALGWATRATSLYLLGILLGRATDRRAAHERAAGAARDARDRAARVHERHREAMEINDSIVQGLASAKWMLEAGRPDRALEIVTETVEVSQQLVSALLSDREFGNGRVVGGVRAAEQSEA